MMTIYRLVFALAVLMQMPDRAEASDIGRLQWLIGSWAQTSESRIITEEWKKVSDNILQGQGFTSSADGTDRKPTETILLVEIEGEVFYIAKAVQNELPVSFRQTHASENEAVFENHDHDFPKRIEYRLRPGGTLSVHVSDGQDRGFSILFTLQNPGNK